MITHRTIAPLLCAAALAACGKAGVQDLTATAPQARVKFFNFGVNAPGVNFYANDTKMTAINSGACTPPTDTTCKSQGIEATLGTAYGQSASGSYYAGIAPGPYTFSGRIAAATDKGLPIANVTATLSDGTAYSFYLSGVYSTTAKKADGFVVEDNYPATVAYDSTYIRFVNAIPNAGPLTLYGKNTSDTTGTYYPVSGAVAYKSAGKFIAFGGGGIVDLVVRNAGSTATAFTRAGVSFGSGRVYTVTAYGDITVTSTTAATRPQLDNTANR